MDIMKPIATSDAPIGKDWEYEVKYDGFRAQLHWDTDSIRLVSRNGIDMTWLFPEIITYCYEQQSHIHTVLPIVLDGELVVLNHPYQANFELIQQRGRLKKKERIEHAARYRPASFLAFDLLQYKAATLKNKPFSKRKHLLLETLTAMGVSEMVHQSNPLSYVPSQTDPAELWNIISENKAEGMIAKRKSSTYQIEKKHHDWYKVKNWRQIEGFLTFYDMANGYFTVQIYDQDRLLAVGKCKHGLSNDDGNVLKSLFTTNGKNQQGGYVLPPAICARINTLDLYKDEIREPNFAEILPQQNAPDCTKNKLQLDMAMLPNAVDVTKTDKVFWPQPELTKGDLLIYMREIAPYMLPFLTNQRLTVIRAPNGINQETFFQKHLPDYAPDFIHSVENDEETFIVCDHLETLIWFANHGAIEYHTPFETVGRSSPYEIVFDLDPPDVTEFSLAIQAALMLKQLLDDLDLISFVKTSGNKGMQVHIPITEGSMSYAETAILTQAIAETMVIADPASFTIERFKKNRGRRLYIDYVQHAAGKTIVTPYSPRLTDSGSVATPLHWEEVTKDLHPDQFTIENVVNRVKTFGCPFAAFFEAGQDQRLDKVKHLLDK